MSNDSVDRRDFLKTSAAAGLGAFMTNDVANKVVSSPLILTNGSPNERLRVAVMGLNSRGAVHARSFAKMANCEVAYLCDVDSKVLDKSMAEVTPLQAGAPKRTNDIRRVLDDKNVDALAIAAPDHWHTPATILALKAGKHVYLEKPVGHNPHEDEIVVAAQQKYRGLVQVGTQRRSGPHFIELRQALKNGVIGTPYLARAWYANTRTSIGKGKPVASPATLDYELWQGPAPRTPYRDNVVHYNWHWFTRWGTGEICNNGTHEIDVARMLLGLDYPTRVYSSGGRYHFDDDWQFPDTQEATFEFEGNKRIVWHSQSCNGLLTHGRQRGTSILGTNGSIVVDQDGYTIHDLKNKVVKESMPGAKTADATNPVGDDALTQMHLDNFASAVRTGTPLSAPVSDGAKTAMLCHLGTIAHQTGRILRTDPKNGHIIGDVEASKLWKREYDASWTPTV
jgi:predicted dehydrogenase